MKSIVQEMVELLKKVDDVEQAATMLVERAYDKGYEIGKGMGLLKRSIETDQQKRDRVVKRAKEFVEGVIYDLYDGDRYDYYNVLRLSGPMSIKFHVNDKKKVVTALLFHKHLNGTPPRYKGFAKCAPNDCFNEYIGKAIALHRALGLGVPQEYLDVPNPTEIRVGDVVSLVNSLGLPYVRSIREFDDDGTVRYVCGGYDHIQQVETGKIIDDSESEPNV